MNCSSEKLERSISSLVVDNIDNNTTARLGAVHHKRAIAFVLRTGLGSSHYTMLQMIKFKHQSVSRVSQQNGLALEVLTPADSRYELNENLQGREVGPQDPAQGRHTLSQFFPH
jgi:hypothetical protein